MEILVVGLGNIGHSMVSMIDLEDVNVDTVTTKGEKVKQIKNNLGKNYSIRNNYSYDTLEKRDYDYVIVTLPYIQKIKRMEQIKDKISLKSTIVILPANQGTFNYLPEELTSNYNFILMERVPFISRIEEKNVSVNIYGTRNDLRFTTIGNVNIEEYKKLYKCFEGLIELPHIDDISFISSNATLHTARVYNLYKNNENYGKELFFYKDWQIGDSELFVDLENEILSIANHKAKLDNRENNVYDMFTHFKIKTKKPDEVQEKISNYPAFQSILFKQESKEDLVKDRYFVDDILLGLGFYLEVANKYEISVPNILKIYTWGVKMVKEVYDCTPQELLNNL